MHNNNIIYISTVTVIKINLQCAYAYYIEILAGSFTKDDTENLIKESILIYKFDHPNVISLIGLCLDAAPSPYIILPFMENGSLLSYIKNSRATLYTNSDTEDEIVSESFNIIIVPLHTTVATYG